LRGHAIPSHEQDKITAYREILLSDAPLEVSIKTSWGTHFWRRFCVETCWGTHLCRRFCVETCWEHIYEERFVSRDIREHICEGGFLSL